MNGSQLVPNIELRVDTYCLRIRRKHECATDWISVQIYKHPKRRIIRRRPRRHEKILLTNTDHQRGQQRSRRHPIVRRFRGILHDRKKRDSFALFQVHEIIFLGVGNARYRTTLTYDQRIRIIECLIRSRHVLSMAFWGRKGYFNSLGFFFDFDAEDHASC